MSSAEDKVAYHDAKCAVASFVANYIAGILHPFDVIKTRLQSHDGKARHLNLVPKYSGMLSAFKQIYVAEGIGGLFKGFYLSLLSQAAASSFFFWLYEKRKQDHMHHSYAFMNSVTFASIEAGIIASCVTQPLWVIKTRMLLNLEPGIGQFRNFCYKGVQIYQHHGVRGYFKGLSINIVLAFIGATGMYFYQGSKILYDKLGVPQTRFSQKNFICGGFSKVASGFVMYPFTTVRTRVQQNQYVQEGGKMKYNGIKDVVSKAWKEEGIRGFYKGIVPNIVKGIPQRGLYFYFYELIKKYAFGIDSSAAKH